ncbi:MAG: hypothetical protein ACRDRJ_42515, partial [Streptosporangiaceae bacterium]
MRVGRALRGLDGPRLGQLTDGLGQLTDGLGQLMLVLCQLLLGLSELLVLGGNRTYEGCRQRLVSL